MSAKIVTAREAKLRLSMLLDETSASHQPILITGKRTNGVLISVEDWRALEETLYLLSIAGMRESIRKGLATPLSECDEEIKR